MATTQLSALEGISLTYRPRPLGAAINESAATQTIASNPPTNSSATAFQYFSQLPAELTPSTCLHKALLSVHGEYSSTADLIQKNLTTDGVLFWSKIDTTYIQGNPDLNDVSHSLNAFDPSTFPVVFDLHDQQFPALRELFLVFPESDIRKVGEVGKKIVVVRKEHKGLNEFKEYSEGMITECMSAAGMENIPRVVVMTVDKFEAMLCWEPFDHFPMA
ncbi:hypothetical protein G7Y89_g4813 [Cudoniella acicularis]|uniref:Uncharacterized protein n=1 Tax=Cudoniella acicularis TaxID=354080 RepID=A0A8H4W3X8_9HELO|nr:hypothetical protein G7Y89_g4813 [Cudoniella acicularis]